VAAPSFPHTGSIEPVGGADRGMVSKVGGHGPTRDAGREDLTGDAAPGDPIGSFLAHVTRHCTYPSVSQEVGHQELLHGHNLLRKVSGEDRAEAALPGQPEPFLCSEWRPDRPGSIEEANPFLQTSEVLRLWDVRVEGHAERRRHLLDVRALIGRGEFGIDGGQGGDGSSSEIEMRGCSEGGHGGGVDPTAQGDDILPDEHPGRCLTHELLESLGHLIGGETGRLKEVRRIPVPPPPDPLSVRHGDRSGQDPAHAFECGPRVVLHIHVEDASQGLQVRTRRPSHGSGDLLGLGGHQSIAGVLRAEECVEAHVITERPETGAVGHGGREHAAKEPGCALPEPAECRSEHGGRSR